MRGGCWLDHRTHLHRLRPARERRNAGDVRGNTRHASVGSLVGDHRSVEGEHSLLRANGDSCLHASRRRAPSEARPQLTPTPRLCWRADQSRGVDLVPQRDRRRPHAGGGHLVADGDRLDHDQPAPWRHHHQTRFGNLCDARRWRRCGGCQRRKRPTRLGRLPHTDAAVALHAARHLGRSCSIQGDLLEPLPRLLLRWRRRAPRRRGLLLVTRSRG